MLASRFYQMKTGHCLTGQYLHWTKSRPTPQCWWCRYQKQTRDHLFEVCPEWKAQQKILWADVLKETGKWKSRWKIRDLLADGRCSQAVLDFLSATDVGRLVLAEEDVGSGSSGSSGSGKERGGRMRKRWVPVGRWVVGRSHRYPYPRPPSWHLPKMRSRGRVYFSLCHFPLSKSFLSAAISFVKTFLGAYLNLLGQAWAEDKGELATCRHRADSGRETWMEKARRHSLDRLHASMNKQKTR